MEGGSTGMLEADDQKVALPVATAVLEVAGAQPRGVKRTRRDRGSTAKERISKMPPCAAGKRSSIYRGVTRHRWTGRYEAHLWDKSTWNQTQNKKGKQVYLGAYDEEEAAARAYDLAALRYWGPGTLINFPLSDYARDVEEMQNVTREEFLASLRRKSSGFSRGVSKYRGVARHHHNGRWEARIGRVFGNKYLYLGTYSTQEEAAAAYDMAAIEYRGLNAVTNFDLSRYIRWLRPGMQNNPAYPETDTSLSANVGAAGAGDDSQNPEDASTVNTQQHSMWPTQSTGPYYRGLGPTSTQERSSAAPTALSLLLQSSMFKQMLERASANAPPEYESNATDPSDVSNRTEKPQQQQQIHSLQQLDNNDNPLYPTWGKQVMRQQHTSSQLVEDEGSVYHKHEDSNPYHQSVTSTYVVGRPYGELDDQKQPMAQRYQDLHRQQHQDHLAAYTQSGYSGSHGPVASLYTEQESGVATSSLEDGSWIFPSVLPMSSIITTC